jgi:hypothetical protein
VEVEKNLVDDVIEVVIKPIQNNQCFELFNRLELVMNVMVQENYLKILVVYVIEKKELIQKLKKKLIFQLGLMIQ